MAGARMCRRCRAVRRGANARRGRRADRELPRATLWTRDRFNRNRPMLTDGVPLRGTVALAMVMCLHATAARAQVTRLEIMSREPWNGSQPVGSAGPYEILR